MAGTSTVTGSDALPRRATRRDWIGLAVIALPCVLYSMDLTVLNLAVPHLSADLRPTSAQLLWILDIYGFFVAGWLITMGTLGDRIGRRRLLLIGAGAFGVASVVAAFSATAGMLIATRAMLGIAGATLAPSTLSLIRNMFHDPRQRTLAIGIWVSSYSIGGAIGPLIGGVMLEYFWWGSVFLIAVPVMAMLLVVGPRLLPEFRDPNAKRMDLTSAALSLVAILTVIYGLKRMAESGVDVLAVAAIVASVIIGVLFVRRQRTLDDPLIDVELFRSARFSTALATYMIGAFVSFGLYVYTAQFLQLVLGMSPLMAGLWTLPSFVAFVAASFVVPQLAHRVAPVHMLAGGLLIAAVGFAIVAGVDSSTPLRAIVLGTVIQSIGLSPVVILATDIIVGSAPVERAGAASAISETSAELGGALGIALLGSVGTLMYRMQIDIPAGSPAEVHEVASRTLGGAVSVSASLTSDAREALLESARHAFTQAFELAAFVAVGISVAASIATALVLGHRQRPGNQPELSMDRAAS